MYGKIHWPPSLADDSDIVGSCDIGFLINGIRSGDPVKIILGDSATEAQIEEVRETMGFNDPFL